MSPDHGTPGNGLLLFFRVDDFDLALQRARSLVTRLEEEPHVNPNTQTKEFSLRDPDGYYVTISALSADPLAGRLLPSDRPFQSGTYRGVFDYSDRLICVASINRYTVPIGVLYAKEIMAEKSFIRDLSCCDSPTD